tara:strand:- start:218 stop:391 length:174 start_codon:yes stop_codon:yes gene_type:complete
MTQTRLAIIIYIIGILIGAFFFDLWGAETNVIKGLAAMFWTALLLIAILFADKEKDN